MLQLVQQTTAELNLAVPTFVAGNTNQDTQQVLALMNRVGYDMVKEYDWQALELEYRFYTTAITTTCDTIVNTYTLTNVANTTGLDSTYSIVGTSIPQDTYVQSVLGATVTTSQLASATSVVARLHLAKLNTTCHLTLKPLPIIRIGTTLNIGKC